MSRAKAKALGEIHYFTGKPCKRGHLSLRFIGGRCVECSREDASINRKTIRATNRRFYHAHRESERNRKDKKKEAARRSKYYRDHAEAEKSRMNKWAVEARKSDPEKYQVRNHNKRAARKGAEGFHTKADVAAIRKAQKNKCAICPVDLGRKGHLDHIKPISKGGSNWPRNLQYLCQPCNNRKAAKDPIEFMQSLGRLL